MWGFHPHPTHTSPKTLKGFIRPFPSGPEKGSFLVRFLSVERKCVKESVAPAADRALMKCVVKPRTNSEKTTNASAKSNAIRQTGRQKRANGGRAEYRDARAAHLIHPSPRTPGQVTGASLGEDTLLQRRLDLFGYTRPFELDFTG
jgi:hypothetical protein